MAYDGVAVGFVIQNLFISPVGSALSQLVGVRICGQPSLSGLFCSHFTAEPEREGGGTIH